MDRAICVTWYDLPAEGRETHLQWLHERYIPLVLGRWAALWAAHYESVCHFLPPGRVRHVEDGVVAAGNSYILLFGARDAHAFADPMPTALHASLPEADRRMLAARNGERTQIFTEEARLAGPESGNREGECGLSPCIQIGSFSAASFEDEEGVLDWYAHNRMAAMKHLTGCLGVRKYVSVTGWAKHGILYEFVSLESRNEHFPGHADRMPEMKAWSDRIVPTLVHAPGSPNVARRLWPRVKRTPAG